MSSLFGAPKPASTSLFGASTATTSAPSGASLFGGATTSNPQPAAGGLFGSTNSQNPPAGGGLFGASNTQNQPSGSGAFGGNTTQNQSSGNSLFGGNATQNQPSGNSLFSGNTTQNQPAGSSLFGGSTTQNQPASNSLFGGNTTQNQPSTTGLFGATNNQNAANVQGSSLFGGGAQQGNPPSNTSSGLFGVSANAGNSLFQPSATSQQQQQQQPTNVASLLQSGLGNGAGLGALGQVNQQDLAASRLRSVNVHAVPNEKTIIDQIQTLIRKWDPNSQDTLMQTYLYNAVNAAYAPFYYRNPDESEKEWEDALAKKPAPVEGADGERVSFVPILVRGFHALGERAEYQARTVNEMRARLHEMNNSLNAVMAKHQQSLSVRVENTRRQHAALSQRALRLAVKAQVLRRRGYPLDIDEEAVRRSLQELEKHVLDDTFRGREEEIWARMVALRERARWLEEEGKRLGGHVDRQNAQNGAVAASQIPEEVITATKKLLGDYDGQLAHLSKEMDQLKKEFEEWEAERGSVRR